MLSDCLKGSVLIISEILEQNFYYSHKTHITEFMTRRQPLTLSEDSLVIFQLTHFLRYYIKLLYIFLISLICILCNSSSLISSASVIQRRPVCRSPALYWVGSGSTSAVTVGYCDKRLSWFLSLNRNDICQVDHKISKS